MSSRLYGMLRRVVVWACRRKLWYIRTVMLDTCLTQYQCVRTCRTRMCVCAPLHQTALRLHVDVLEFSSFPPALLGLGGPLWKRRCVPLARTGIAAPCLRISSPPCALPLVAPSPKGAASGGVRRVWGVCVSGSGVGRGAMRPGSCLLVSVGAAAAMGMRGLPAWLSG